ncbi:MAG: amidohydrolase family protein [Candidatus Berkelbacteria bacterium]|nr:amidohydrolase family protein [Candidatus Berkelbacteria bacterium]
MNTELKFIDTHFHLWDLNHLHYGWLTDEIAEGHVIGDYSAICKNYLIEDYIRDTAGSGLVKAVHVQAAVGHPNPVDETCWLQSIIDKSPIPNAIIGSADLCDRNCAEVLDRHLDCDAFRGVRMFAEPGLFQCKEFADGFSLLEKKGLIFDMDVGYLQMEEACQLAKQFPNVQIILGHAGFPQERTPAYFEAWKKGISRLAEAENIACKISGLGMADHNWTVESIRPWVMHCIEAFGIDRCMFGSNWPVDSMFSDYKKLIAAYSSIIRDFQANERVKLFSQNAEKFYRI